jgi:serine/threonine protein kinase
VFVLLHPYIYFLLLIDHVQAIVDGDPPDLPAEGYSEAARDFVRGCLHKIPKMRPTYAMLLRHAWLAPLMKPPTISEDEAAEAAAEAGTDTPSAGETSFHPETADKEVADWVCAAFDRKLSGQMGKSKKPALHAAPLDAVPGSPLLDRQGLKFDTSSTSLHGQNQSVTKNDEDIAAAISATRDAEMVVDTKPRAGTTVESPVSRVQKVHSIDFADGVGQSTESDKGDKEEFEIDERAPRTASKGAEEQNKDG